MRALILLLLALLPVPSQAQQPREFRDCADCPLMVTIPAGRFTMGVPPGEEEAEGLPAETRGRSVPQTRIAFAQPFAMGKNPITRAEFAAFLQDSGHTPGNSCWQLTEQGNGQWRYQERQGMNWQRPNMGQTANDPVVCVSWDDAQAYAGWLARRTGRRYRLPSEAEWEFAARAGTTGPRYWAGGRDAACAHANVRDYSLAGHYNFVRDSSYFACADGFPHTSPVGSFPPNPYGLNDMLGNIAQWTADCWNPTLQGQPANGAARATGDCASRVVRGGAWGAAPWDIRSGIRGSFVNRFSGIGFRISRTQ